MAWILVCRWSIMELWSVWCRGAHSCSASFVPGTTARRIGRLWLQRRAPLERRSRSQGLLAGFEHSQVSIAGVLSVKAFASFVFGSPVLCLAFALFARVFRACFNLRCVICSTSLSEISIASPLLRDWSASLYEISNCTASLFEIS
mgnify:CR=1 FL=1